MKNMMLAIAVLALLSGCAGIRQKQAEMQREFEQSIPHCEGEKQCSERWSAAQVWVSKNCGMKIQLATDSLIETYNSAAARNSTTLGASVTKEPLGNGRYRIAIRTGCANIFGCFPDAHQSALDFNRYVGSI